MLWKLKFVFPMASNYWSDVALFCCVSYTAPSALYLSLGSSCGTLLVEFMQTFWKWLCYLHAVHLFQKAGHLLGSHIVPQYLNLLLVSHHELLTFMFSFIGFMEFIMSKSFSQMLFSIPFLAVCTPTLFAKLILCSLMMSVVFCTMVNFLMISAVIIYSIDKMLFQLLIRLFIVTHICFNS